ncbi:MAG TPA: hypothetical protein PK417_02320 [Hyphomonas sp.]|nr:hypothetical protein [Hyphomonas sp.]HRX74523.1 hypothetical protein [Hyphomonas sp.]
MNCMYRFGALAGALLVTAPLALAEGEGPQASYSTGVFYTTGKYGYDETTDIIRVPLDISVSAGRVTLFADLPWLYADGPADAATAGQLGGTATSRFPRLASRLDGTDPAGSVDGIGDATVGVTTRLTPETGATWLGVTVMATLPTGDEDKGLGTGSTDLLAELAVERWMGSWALTGAAGYAWLGDEGEADPEADPPLLALEDYAFARIGVRYRLISGGTLGSDLAWTESADPALEDIVELSVSWIVPLSETVSLGTYLSGGLAGDGSDAGAGVTLTITP